ncbi:MAG: glycoside hydrolase family 127 protein [Bacteroidetes bacterium]|nr:glycoside hydrolase family 127 protein [Bacteroidota bacterium]MCW5894699.1 glycoside hydrolase family 127 protein [Bacteroidota bacterium]
MRNLSIIVFAISATAWAQQPARDYPVTAVPFTQVRVSDAFWAPRIEMNRSVTIPSSFDHCRTTGRIKNFEMAAERKGKFLTKYSFDDTDIYKTLEGASYALSTHPDKHLDAYLDSLIELISRAQEPDGYLFTERTMDPVNTSKRIGSERWVNERLHSHELYNAGHLYEAAAAHFLATGKRSLLGIALKNADLIDATFGPGKRRVAPGHQVIEMGLAKLYRITGDEKYLRLARFFLDERGRVPYDTTSKDVFRNGKYWQDHKLVVDQKEAVGHAVRAVYMYSAMADIAALTGDASYIRAIDTLWENVVGKKMYVHGGIGAAGDGERFGENYELPNRDAYCETCAAIGNVFWNHRMFLLHGNAKYIDVLERILYNGLISGFGLDGKTFFYTNAMQISKHYRHPDIELSRSTWFPCSCCPTNITRFVPSIPGYIFAQKEKNIYVNLFVSGETEISLPNGVRVALKQETNYPWNGKVRIAINTGKSARFSVNIRIPGWLSRPVPSDLYSYQSKRTASYSLTVNGSTATVEAKDGYAILDREWKKNDVVEIDFPMNIERMVSHPNLKENSGKVALQRGPLVYCAEWVDNGGLTSNLLLPDDTELKAEFRLDLLNGVMTLSSEVPAFVLGKDGKSVTTERQQFVAIPYYAWAHRGEGEMNIWLPRALTGIEIINH